MGFSPKGAIKGFLNGADDVITGGATNRAVKYFEEGSQTAVKANKSVTKQGIFARGLNATKKSKFGKMLTDDAEFKQTLKAVDDAKVEEIRQNISILENDANKLRSAVGNIDTSQPNTPLYNLNAEYQLESLEDKIARGKQIVDTGHVQTREGIGDYLGRYYGHEKYGTARKVATVGAVAGLGLAGRYATGGNLTYNGDGRRDIIGVPFI